MKFIPLMLALSFGLQEEKPSRVTRHEEAIYEDAFFDVDTATSLSRASVGNVAADVQFSRQDGKLKLIPVNKARIGMLDFKPLDAFDEKIDTRSLSADPVEIVSPFALVGRTSEGKAFKATVHLSWMAVAAGRTTTWGGEHRFLNLEYALQENGTDLIPGRVRKLEARFTGGVVRVSWENSEKETYRVRWRRDDSATARGHRDISGGGFEIKDLERDTVFRVEVTRLFSNGGEGEPCRTSVLTTPAGSERRSLRIERQRGHEYRINLRTGASDESDPDLIPYFWGIKTPAGGGLQWLGTGERVFESTVELPDSGYVRRSEAFREKYVYAVRLRDGRYAKVWVKTVGDVRDGLDLEIVFIKGGGRKVDAGPRNLVASYDGTKVRLAWSAREGAAEYVVFLRGEGKTVEVGRTREAFVDLPDAEKQEFLAYGVASVDQEGVRSDLSLAAVATFAAPFKVGTFELGGRDDRDQPAFSFAQLKNVDAASGDLVITNSAGGGSSLGIKGRYGIGGGIHGGFGKIDAKMLRSLASGIRPGEINTDDRSPETMKFRIRSSEGGYAHVRIIGFDASYAMCQFVYLPRPDLRGMIDDLKSAAKEPTDAQTTEIQRLIERLDSEKIEDREKAHESLIAQGAKAVVLLDEAWKKSSSAELRGRIEAVIREIWERQP